MFDIGWSEFLLIGAVALIVLGPKELPGVLRMVGQWVTKARRMASDFQGQFQDAMREAEMADVKKSFDEIKESAHDFTGGNLLTSAQKDVQEALKLDTSRDTPHPTTPASDVAVATPAPVASLSEAPSAALGIEPPVTAPQTPAHAATEVEPTAANSSTPAPEPEHKPQPVHEAKAS